MLGPRERELPAIAIAIAKMMSASLAALGWKAVTGTPPPGQVEEPMVG